jgi:hypothetical protein
VRVMELTEQHDHGNVTLNHENAKVLNTCGACNSCVAQLILVNSEHLSPWRMEQHAF